MSKRKPAKKLSLLKAFAQPSAGTMFFLGLASGLPFLLPAGTLSYWLNDSGLDIKNITMIASAGMAYSLKFLWSPLVDRLRLPVLRRFGQRRSWLLLAQLAVMAGLLLMAWISPDRLGLFIGCTLLVAFAGATIDIAVDAYRIEIAPAEAQGALIATYSLGYRVGLIVAGAMALALSDLVSWSHVYQTMAAVMIVPVIAVLLAHEPAALRVRTEGWRQSMYEGVVAPFVDFFVRYRASVGILLLLFILIFKISDQALVGGLMGPFYRAQGFEKTEIAAITKIYGIWVGMAGTFLGGVAVAWIGIRRSLLIGIVVGAASNLLYLMLIGANGNLKMLTLVISGENLAQGFLGTASVAFLSALVNKRFTATQYALFSSLITLPGKVLGFFSGGIVDAAGGNFAPYFWITTLIAVPALILYFVLMPQIRLDDDESG